MLLQRSLIDDVFPHSEAQRKPSQLHHLRLAAVCLFYEDTVVDLKIKRCELLVDLFFGFE